MTDRLTEQVVLITGAAGNLGNAVAQTFLDAGARLALVDHKSGRLENEFPELAGSSEHVFLNGVDMTDPQQVAAMVTSARDHFGKIDVLVNTVGGYRAGDPVHETTVELWDFMMNLNARSAFLSCRAVIPHLLEQKSGKIINVGAGAALKGTKNHAAYSASKSAVVRLTESLSAELKPSGINVNCVLPSTIDTPENRESMPKSDFSKWVKPESLAQVILFLASASAGDIHGAAIPV